MIIEEQGNQIILTFLIASCCTGVIFFTLLFRTLLRITGCSDVSDEEEERKMCSCILGNGMGKKDGLVVCKKNANAHILSLNFPFKILKLCQ